MYRSLKKIFGFFLARRGLLAEKAEITIKVTEAVGSPVFLQPYLKGRGWGLKYLVYPKGAAAPTHLVKAASRVIEHRVQAALGQSYCPHRERFAQEAGFIRALAEKGLGPALLLHEPDFFVREYFPGETLGTLGYEHLARWLPEALDSLDRMCDLGLFHTDPNAENVIVDTRSGRIGFIDREVPSSHSGSGPLEPEFRSYCHERLLSTLGESFRGKSRAARDTILEVARAYYERHHEALSPEQALGVLKGEHPPRERPE